MPYGRAIWQSHVAEPYGRRAIWQSRMAKPYGIPTAAATATLVPMVVTTATSLEALMARWSYKKKEMTLQNDILKNVLKIVD